MTNLAYLNYFRNSFEKREILYSDTNRIIKELLSIINTEKDLDDIALAFVTLRDYNISIKTFDFKKAKQLSKQY